MIHDFYFVFYSILFVKISDGLSQPSSECLFILSTHHVEPVTLSNEVHWFPLLFYLFECRLYFSFPFLHYALLCVVLGYIALVMRSLVRLYPCT